MEWKLFLGDGADSCSFEKGKTLFHFPPPSAKQTISVLSPTLGTADGPALPSAWELNSRVWKSHSGCIRKQQYKANAQAGLHALPFQSWTLR